MKKGYYGYELIVNLYGCNRRTISSRRKIQEYVDILCRLIKMKKYGQALIPYFGTKSPHTKGYSLVQLIETSSIVAHFSELFQSAYFNIFSCKKFDAKKAREFTREFFEARRIASRLIVRK